MREPADVERTAGSLRIDAELVDELEDASTVDRAAAELGVDAGEIAKSIVLMVKEAEPVVVIVPGPSRVATGRVAEHVKAEPSEVRMAEPDEIERFTGYPVGGVPPFGHERPLRTLIDRTVLDHETVYTGGGSKDTMMKVKGADLRKLPDVTLGDFSEPDDG